MNVVIDKLLCDVESDQNLEIVSRNELLKNSDFISMHVPATKATKGMIDNKFVKNLKEDAVLINISDYDL
jgi:phosphoglycerate dehydrogenase-like enzyme